MKRHCVPVLITGDIDPTPEATVAEKKDCLLKTRDLFAECDIRGTFFTVAETGQIIKQEVQGLLRQGHEIGCHGLTHSLQEEYSTMSEEQVRASLPRATEMLEEITGEKVVSFRGPRVKTSSIAQGVLEELGYRVDSSVCSQRIDFISSNRIHTGWIRAPRLPYHPSVQSPFRKGERNLWVVPVSAAVFPFVSGMMYTFGLSLVKKLFHAFYQESKRTGKPVVYLFHPVEFAKHTVKVKHRFTIQNFRAEGLRLRRSKWLFEKDEKRRLWMNRELFLFMKSLPGVVFCSMKEYVDTVLERRS